MAQLDATERTWESYRRQIGHIETTQSHRRLGTNLLISINESQKSCLSLFPEPSGESIEHVMNHEYGTP